MEEEGRGHRKDSALGERIHASARKAKVCGIENFYDAQVEMPSSVESRPGSKTVQVLHLYKEVVRRTDASDSEEAGKWKVGGPIHLGRKSKKTPAGRKSFVGGNREIAAPVNDGIGVSHTEKVDG